MFNTNVAAATSTEILRYEYALKDHLGNTRLTFTDKNGNGLVDQTNLGSTNEVIQESHYYPFGLDLPGFWINDGGALDNQYKYNGKELNGDFGLGWMDYGARWYDASVGRWWSVDPVTKHPESAYMAFNNNPTIIIDPMGADTSFADNDTRTDFLSAYQMLSNKMTKLNKTYEKKWADWKKSGFMDIDQAQKISEIVQNISELSYLKGIYDAIMSPTTPKFYIRGMTDPNGNTIQTGGDTQYNYLTKTIDITYGIGNPHSLTHEARHGLGYLNGEWGSVYDPSSALRGKSKVYSYDYQDEYEGVKAGIMFLRLMYGGREAYSTYNVRNESEPNIRKYVIEHYTDPRIIKDFRQICEDEK